MKIVIALGNAADTGGPTKYAQNLQIEFARRGHTAVFVSYKNFLWKLPFGVRHVGYMLQLLPHAMRADAILGFDTLTVGAPALIASKFARVPLVIRVGGDFLWEQYVERSGDLVKLSRFYQEARGRWTLKERAIFSLTRMVARGSAKLVFNCRFLPELWQEPYGLKPGQWSVVENLYPPRKEGSAPNKKNFVAAGRDIKLKNEALLREVMSEIVQKYPDAVLDTSALPAKEHQARVQGCYCVVLASVSDVSPNAIIDAVAYGKPFICTADTGIRERLEGSGLFVDTQNKEELKGAIETLLDPAQYEKIAARVRVFNFTRTWEDVSNDFEAILKQVMQK